MTNVETPFEILPVRKRELVPVSANQYRIITVQGEKNVEANTAYEAFKLSGLKDAIKIERLSVIKPIIIKKGAFVEQAATSGSSDAIKSEIEEFAQLHKLMKPVMSTEDLDKVIHTGALHAPVIATAKNISGTELHGDGFDEIIPASQPVAPKPQAAAAATPKEAAPQRVEIPHAKDQTVTPEQNLSPEEVEKLLGHK